MPFCKTSFSSLLCSWVEGWALRIGNGPLFKNTQSISCASPKSTNCQQIVKKNQWLHDSDSRSRKLWNETIYLSFCISPICDRVAISIGPLLCSLVGIQLGIQLGNWMSCICSTDTVNLSFCTTQAWSLYCTVGELFASFYVLLTFYCWSKQATLAQRAYRAFAL